MINLIDVSFLQAPKSIDWEAVKNAGISGVYVRCGEGLKSKDPAFVEHVERIQGAGLKAGAYYVGAPSTQNPKASAETALTWAGECGDLMPLVIDIERNRALGADAPVWAEFFTAMGKELNCRWMAYTYLYFREALEPLGFRPPEWFIARYPSLMYGEPQAQALCASAIGNMAKFNAAIIKGDSKAAQIAAQARSNDAIALSKLGSHVEPLGSPPSNCRMWQWGGDANGSTVPGVFGFCDRSYFYGTDDEWNNFHQYPKWSATEITAMETEQRNPK